MRRVSIVLATIVTVFLWQAALAQEHGRPAPAADAHQAQPETAHGDQPAGEAGGAHGGGHGSPQLLPSPAAGIAPAITTLVVFALLLIVLGKYAWRPIASGLKAREDRIRADITEAETARLRAEQTLREYNTQLAAAEERGRQMVAQAVAQGEQLATSIRMKAQTEAEDIKERAQRDIEAARDSALREIYEKTAELATSVAEKIIRRSLNAQDQQDLVRQSLEQLQEVK